MASNTRQYRSLRRVLHMAEIRASHGKGAQRHGTTAAFEHQGICQEQRLMNSIAPAIYQIRKKALELLRFPHPAQQINELCDVIVYAASAIIVLEEEANEIKK